MNPSTAPDAPALPRLVLFDLDHTLLPIDSDFEWGEFTQRIGSSYGRLQTEFVERGLHRSVALLKSIGKMPDFKIDGREITLKHLSPLARAQDQEELLGLQTAVAMAPMAAKSSVS